MYDPQKCAHIAQALLTPNKGILAADQSARTMNKQLAAIGVPEEAEMRRQYRQLLFTTPNLEQYVTGVILYDATIRNQADDGTPFVDILTAKGIIPIIKVDKSTVPHIGFPDEVVTQGLDGLGERLQEYYDMGARAAKWRAVITISDNTPTEQNILFDCMMLARYAALCHEVGIVPILEPEVIFAGSHDIARAEAVTTQVLQKMFEIMSWYKIDLHGVVLKSSFVLAGSEHPEQSAPELVAEATIRTFENSVPSEVPGIVFLSGGQTPERATANLNAVAAVEKERGSLPWQLAFSFSRGLEQPAQTAWAGQAANVPAAQTALLERLRLNSLADQAEYEAKLEE